MRAAPRTREERQRSAEERDHRLAAASVAAQLQAPALEKSAPRIPLDLASYEPRQAARLVAPIAKARPCAAHHLVQGRLLRASALVSVCTIHCRIHIRVESRPCDLQRGVARFGRASRMRGRCHAKYTSRAGQAKRLLPVVLRMTSRRETPFGRPRSASASWRPLMTRGAIGRRRILGGSTPWNRQP